MNWCELIRGVRAKINLIAFNPGPGLHFKLRPERGFQNSRRS